MSGTLFALFVSCPKGLEYLLEEELRQLGLSISRVSPQGVYGDADLTILYRICLGSRLANRVQMILFDGVGSDRDTLYTVCRQFAWETVFSVDKSFAIEFHGASEQIRNTMFGAQVVKDAIVDYFQQQLGSRPCIQRENPDIRLHAYLKQDLITVSFDLCGYSLHQRGYRSEAGVAPLKENIAAALLVRAKWPEFTAAGMALHDPCCGSGTIVIEAAMMAAGIAPGLLREDQSLQHWVGHHPELWQQLRATAMATITPPPLSPSLSGSDNDAASIEKAKANAARAGVSSWVNFTVASISECKASAKTGLLIGNPPYGERLDEAQQLIPLYRELGLIAHQQFSGWEAAILTSNPELAKAIGLRAHKHYAVYNGALPCKLYCIHLDAANQLRHNQQRVAAPLSPQAEMLANRLEKNRTHLNKWANRNQIQCYRVYDADLSDYNYAIDIYQDYAVLQEYIAPAHVDAEKAAQRSAELLQVVPQALHIEPNKIVVKQRKQQKGKQQYEKINQSQHHLVVDEGAAKLKVNLYDYLDTGLFLDHRLLRLRFAKLASGSRFLNCFCYTASASVHAALAGASTTNIDLSKTYLNWAKDNFMLNQLNPAAHQFIQDDVLSWLDSNQQVFDVIFLDPPSFSNSKRMSDTLDVQRDHERMIHAAMKLLSRKGTLYFSTNLRRFSLSLSIKADYQVVDITAQTIDIDFKRNQKIHQCYTIQRPAT